MNARKGRLDQKSRTDTGKWLKRYQVRTGYISRQGDRAQMEQEKHWK